MIFPAEERLKRLEFIQFDASFCWFFIFFYFSCALCNVVCVILANTPGKATLRERPFVFCFLKGFSTYMLSYTPDWPSCPWTIQRKHHFLLPGSSLDYNRPKNSDELLSNKPWSMSSYPVSVTYNSRNLLHLELSCADIYFNLEYPKSLLGPK